MTKTVLALVVVVAARTAAAEPRLPSDVQADVGLSVVYLGYEAPITEHVAVAFTGGIFGTYFLPWFDLGDNVKGVGFGVRATWFAHTSGKGLYVAPYFRGVAVQGDLGGDTARGYGYTTGAFLGWAFRMTPRLDLRVGAGAQYIKFHIATDIVRSNNDTPFVALDTVLAYRL